MLHQCNQRCIIEHSMYSYGYFPTKAVETNFVIFLCFVNVVDVLCSLLIQSLHTGLYDLRFSHVSCKYIQCSCALNERIRATKWSDVINRCLVTCCPCLPFQHVYDYTAYPWLSEPWLSESAWFYLFTVNFTIILQDRGHLVN